MNKKLSVLILSIFVALGFAVTAQAQVSIGVSIQPYPDAGSNPCTDPLVTNQIYTVTIFASNSSFNGNPTNPANLIPVFLEGKVIENDACSSLGCPPGSEIPSAIKFLGCSPLDACISNCQETAPGSGIVTFDIAPNCLLLGPGQQFKPIVSIQKQALIPYPVVTVDCTIPSDYGKIYIAAKCLDNLGTLGVDCQVRDPVSGQTGFSSGNSEIYYPPAPACIEVTKNCEPDTACFETPITFSGTITNCGEVDIQKIQVVDDKGIIDTIDCGFVMPIGDTCSYTGHYTAPIVVGGNADTVTVTGETPYGELVSGQASDTCIQVEGNDVLPDCGAAYANPGVLQPANHRMFAIEILGVTDPDGDPVTITIDTITQDEPVSTGKEPDGSGVGTDTAFVRAEMLRKGNGRVYAISFTADDGKGGLCKGAVNVCVPAGEKDKAGMDDGQSYDSTIP